MLESINEIILNLDNLTSNDVVNIWVESGVDELPTEVQQFVFQGIVKANCQYQKSLFKLKVLEAKINGTALPRCTPPLLAIEEIRADGIVRIYFDKTVVGLQFL